jgi:hypothetical protein
MTRYKHHLENLAGDLESRYGKEDLFVQEVPVAITQVATKSRDVPSPRLPGLRTKPTARLVTVQPNPTQPVE